ncbi:hypothetical protein KKB64_02045 [Patescibacteria group bacterium]|nr:hypothetical protein [Patescibacteria group bacterium]MBU1472552.1 hypothetical protein [Patescibacteria group bacterium]MBU2460074.1 hypothetical protein [Patescibacteria group bacterium]MBU2544643.1 hypothetical protein [Patescibacteria group bacterium]
MTIRREVFLFGLIPLSSKVVEPGAREEIANHWELDMTHLHRLTVNVTGDNSVQIADTRYVDPFLHNRGDWRDNTTQQFTDLEEEQINSSPDLTSWEIYPFCRVIYRWQSSPIQADNIS